MPSSMGCETKLTPIMDSTKIERRASTVGHAHASPSYFAKSGTRDSVTKLNIACVMTIDRSECGHVMLKVSGRQLF